MVTRTINLELHYSVTRKIMVVKQNGVSFHCLDFSSIHAWSVLDPNLRTFRRQGGGRQWWVPLAHMVTFVADGIDTHCQENEGSNGETGRTQNLQGPNPSNSVTALILLLWHFFGVEQTHNLFQILFEILIPEQKVGAVGISGSLYLCRVIHGAFAWDPYAWGVLRHSWGSECWWKINNSLNNNL